MRKIKLQVQMSVDGFVAGPNGEMDWMTWNWDDTLKNYVNELTSGFDLHIIGRKTYEGMEHHWPAAELNDAQPEEQVFAHVMNTMEKLVFSRTLKTADWTNSKIANGTIEEEVARIKAMPGKDIVIYGGAGLVSQFVKLNLIDEYHLFINPAIIGKGMSIFNTVETINQLHLVKTVSSSVGITIMVYEPKR